MEVPNISLLFNKILFKSLYNQDSFKNDTKSIHQKLFKFTLDQQHINLLNIQNQCPTPNRNRSIKTFDLTTVWPGLLIGLGYGHSTGINKDEFKNGFYFDFTTGLPVLPGSTVKGVLRSFFPERFDISVKDKEFKKEVLAKKSNVLNRLISILNNLNISPNISLDANEWNEETIKELENIIFEGKVKGKKISSNIQDIFFDAFPNNAGSSNVVEGNFAKEYEGVFLGEDIITPHKHPLKVPLPLRCLKILPGVTFHFQFYLNNIGISSEDKIKLFKELLLQFGAGAKSSVGFGKFVNESEPVVSDDWYIGFQPLKRKTWNAEDPPIEEDENWINPEEIKKGDIIEATVLSSLNGNLKVKLHVKGDTIISNLQGKGENRSIVDVKVQNIEGSINRGNFTIKVVLFT